MSKAGIGDEAKKSLKDLAGALRREREHLAVQVELGRMELKDEWLGLERKWDRFEQRLEELGDDAKDAAHRLGHELEEAYNDLRDRLKRD